MYRRLIYSYLLAMPPLFCLLLGCAAEMFSSVAEMEAMVVNEKQLADKLDLYIEAQQQRLDVIDRYLERLEMLAEDAAEHGILHPAAAFLHIVALSEGLDNLMAYLTTDKTPETQLESAIAFRDTITLPDATDLKGAAIAIARLQRVYELDARHFADGLMHSLQMTTDDETDQQPEPVLSMEDCFIIATELFAAEQYDYAFEWHNLVVERCTEGEAIWAPCANEYIAICLAESSYVHYLSGNATAAVLQAAEAITYDGNCTEAHDFLKLYFSGEAYDYVDEEEMDMEEMQLPLEEGMTWIEPFPQLLTEAIPPAPNSTMYDKAKKYIWEVLKWDIPDDEKEVLPEEEKEERLEEDSLWWEVGWPFNLIQENVTNANGTNTTATNNTNVSIAAEAPAPIQAEIAVAQVEEPVTEVTEETEEETAEFVENDAVVPGYEEEEGSSTDVGRYSTEAFLSACRGDDRVFGRSPADEKELRCRITDNGVPFMKLQPIHVEELDNDPEIKLFRNFATDSEINHLIPLGLQELQRAHVVNLGDMTDEELEEVSIMKVRTAKNAWIQHNYSDITAAIARRAQAVTGLSLENEHGEAFQLANYGIGGHYDPHYDFFSYNNNYMLEGYQLEDERVATFMLYLSDVEAGGATVFVRRNLTIWPRKGDALFWYNLRRDGSSHGDTLHAGCPVLIGSKWVMNLWIKTVGQELKRPCLSHPDVTAVDEQYDDQDDL